MRFLQTAIQSILGAAMMRTLPPGTILYSPRGVPHKFKGMDSDLDGNVTLQLVTGWQTNSPKQFSPQEVPIVNVATSWTVDNEKVTS